MIRKLASGGYRLYSRKDRGEDLGRKRAPRPETSAPSVLSVTDSPGRANRLTSYGPASSR
jgi:hypothetical protein